MKIPRAAEIFRVRAHRNLGPSLSLPFSLLLKFCDFLRAVYLPKSGALISVSPCAPSPCLKTETRASPTAPVAFSASPPSPLLPPAVLPREYFVVCQLCLSLFLLSSFPLFPHSSPLNHQLLFFSNQDPLKNGRFLPGAVGRVGRGHTPTGCPLGFRPGTHRQRGTRPPEDRHRPGHVSTAASITDR